VSEMKRKPVVPLLAVSAIVLCTLVSLTGCTSDQNENQVSNVAVNPLLGTWTGHTMMPAGESGFGNMSISQLTFKESSVVVTQEGQFGSATMNCTYMVQGSSIVLQPEFTGGRGRHAFNGTFPTNSTWRQFDGTWQVNGSGGPQGGHQFNGSFPGNWSLPGNGTWSAGGGRPMTMISLTYSFDEQQDVLYLNGSPFTKTQ
jgi:hypothetical protein